MKDKEFNVFLELIKIYNKQVDIGNCKFNKFPDECFKNIRYDDADKKCILLHYTQDIISSRIIKNLIDSEIEANYTIAAYLLYNIYLENGETI